MVLIDRLDADKEGISKLEYQSVETPQTEVQKKKTVKWHQSNQNIASKNFRQYQVV
jgi:hypothetical protein